MKTKKKGIILFDLIIVIAFLMMGVITAMIGITILDDFDASARDVSDNYNSSYVQDARMAVAVTDSGSMLIFIGLIVGAIISSYALREHPVYAIFSVILLFITAFIVAGLSNFYEDFAQDPNVVVAAAEFPGMNLLMQNIVAIIFILGTIIIIVMYANGKGDQVSI